MAKMEWLMVLLEMVAGKAEAVDVDRKGLVVNVNV